MENSEKGPEHFKISTLPETIYYIPNFITPSEEAHILSSLPHNRWINLSHRRLQAHPSVLSKTNTLLASPLPHWLQEPILPRFHALGLFDGSPHKTPNHVLINEYNPGEGIMPHEDGAAYFPLVATVSLGAPIVLDVYEKRCPPSSSSTTAAGSEDDDRAERRATWRVFQEPRSLLVTLDEAYTALLHGIAEVEVDEDLGPATVANWDLLGQESKRLIEESGGGSVRGTRTSLTYRDVLKVSKVGSSIFGKART